MCEMTQYELAPARKVIYAYDAFVSYNSRDREIVESISRLLEEHSGLLLWKDDWELTGGQDWLEALPEGIGRCRSLIAFGGANGIGPWHKEEIKVAMRKAVESGAMKIIPTLLPGAPDRPDLPEFLKSRHYVDIRQITPWTIRLLRCAITDEGAGTAVVKTFFLRTLQVARHPSTESVPIYRAPIGRVVSRRMYSIPSERKAEFGWLEPERQLRAGEVEDLVVIVQPPEGYRVVVSFGFHWHVVGEPALRQTETGFLGLGERGHPPIDGFSIIPAERDSYSAGQHNLDEPRILPSSMWPPGWPESFTAADEAYMDG
jgi:hypothetical protein